MERVEISVGEALERAIEAKKESRAETIKKKTIEVEEIPKGEKLTWNVTPEQVAKINAGEREALDAFFLEEDNLQRIRYTSYFFMRHHTFLRSVISSEDLVQQFYVDLRSGLVKLRPFDKAISKAIFRSFQYAAVGGLDEVYVYE